MLFLFHRKSVEQRQLSNQNESQSQTTNNTDHRVFSSKLKTTFHLEIASVFFFLSKFIHELFHLCIKYPPRSSKIKSTVPSHSDMKTFIRQTFSDLIKTSSAKVKPIDLIEFDRQTVEVFRFGDEFPVELHSRLFSIEMEPNSLIINQQMNSLSIVCQD